MTKKLGKIRTWSFFNSYNGGPTVAGYNYDFTFVFMVVIYIVKDEAINQVICTGHQIAEKPWEKNVGKTTRESENQKAFRKMLGHCLNNVERRLSHFVTYPSCFVLVEEAWDW